LREHVHPDLRAASERRVAGEKNIRHRIDRCREMDRVRRSKPVSSAELRRALDDRGGDVDDARVGERRVVACEQRGVRISQRLGTTFKPRDARLTRPVVGASFRSRASTAARQPGTPSIM
jgi:hypothetical protein